MPTPRTPTRCATSPRSSSTSRAPTVRVLGPPTGRSARAARNSAPANHRRPGPHHRVHRDQLTAEIATSYCAVVDRPAAASEGRVIGSRSNRTKLAASAHLFRQLPVALAHLDDPSAASRHQIVGRPESHNVGVVVESARPQYGGGPLATLLCPSPKWLIRSLTCIPPVRCSNRSLALPTIQTSAAAAVSARPLRRKTSGSLNATRASTRRHAVRDSIRVSPRSSVGELSTSRTRAVTSSGMPFHRNGSSCSVVIEPIQLDRVSDVQHQPAKHHCSKLSDSSGPTGTSVMSSVSTPSARAARPPLRSW